MTQQVWITAGMVSIAAVLGLLFLWVRMPVYRWSCRRCKRIVSTSRFRPAPYLRREHAGGQFLQEVRQLEHVAGADPALCRLFIEGA